MALYQITVDCRIANKDFKKWDVVSGQEVEYFPSVMSPIGENVKVDTPVAPAPVKAPEEPTEETAETPEEVEEPTTEEEKADEVEEGEKAEEETEDEEEKMWKKSAKKSKKK